MTPQMSGRREPALALANLADPYLTENFTEFQSSTATVAHID